MMRHIVISRPRTKPVRRQVVCPCGRFEMDYMAHRCDTCKAERRRKYAADRFVDRADVALERQDA